MSPSTPGTFVKVAQRPFWQRRNLISSFFLGLSAGLSALPDLLAKWEPIVGVKVERVFVQRMKTKWGSSNPDTDSIRLNTDLAKKPPECLEYIVVHEMVHLLEPTHNARFVALMDRIMQQWRVCREQLNQLPVRHEEWSY
jgi:hypothetical protein